MKFPDYNPKESDQAMQTLWLDAKCAEYKAEGSKKTHSVFLIPPNISGPIHVGNALMVALQDIEARYHRAQGESVLWIPGLDHGGYETQVTYERSAEEKGVTAARHEYRSEDLFPSIEEFVTEHRSTIVQQISSLGASVDWSRLRYTLDDPAIAATNNTFQKLVGDGLVGRKSYMVHYCPHCATVLADIELKKKEVAATRYGITFNHKDSEGSVMIETVAPEQLFSMTHILVHYDDKRYAQLIGMTLINPCTGAEVQVVKSTRSVKWHTERDYLAPFLPSFDRYDYEYAIRNHLPARSYLDWEGLLMERYPGHNLQTAHNAEIKYFKEQSALSAEHDGEMTQLLCKKGHEIVDLIRLSWFLDIDGEQISIRKKTLEVIENEKLHIHPAWRKKGLVEWLHKMIDWPISRQNVWGVSMPVWYLVEDASQFMVWFFDDQDQRHYGNLQELLDAGHTFEVISAGLQRVYASAQVVWTTDPVEGGLYLKETDTFDTWFTSGAWSVFVFKDLEGVDFDIVYPSESVVIGSDLLRLSIARKLFMSVYLTGKMPFEYVYFHPLVLGADGQKMSKSLGNSVSLNTYLDVYGADVTRMSLVSYMDQAHDFVFEESNLMQYQEFVQDVWRVARAYNVILDHNVTAKSAGRLNDVDFAIVRTLRGLGKSVGGDIERHFYARAQEKVVAALPEIEQLVQRAAATGSVSAASAFLQMWQQYLIVLHPFAPHVSEAVYQSIPDKQSDLLATAYWPR